MVGNLECAGINRHILAVPRRSSSMASRGEIFKFFLAVADRQVQPTEQFGSVLTNAPREACRLPSAIHGSIL